MNAVAQLHPEELLDKQARGTLGAEERARLDAHLAQCTTCRFELMVRDDFLDELESGERPSFNSLIDGALGLAAKEEPTAALPNRKDAPSEIDAPRVVAPRRARRSTFLLFAAAALLVATAAAATPAGRSWLRKQAVTLVEGERGEGAGTKAVLPPSPRGVHGTSTSLLPPSGAPLEPHVASAASAAPAAPDTALPNPAEPAISRGAPLPVLHGAPRGASGRASPVRPNEEAPLTPPAAPPVDVPAPPAASAVNPVPAPLNAHELFAQAGAARQAGDLNGALLRYRELEQRFPESREAATARAVVGRLLLDRGDTAGALSSFDAYLRSGRWELREEARAGRAQALGSLGREADEARAWEALLSEFPATSYAKHARARLERLGGR